MRMQSPFGELLASVWLIHLSKPGELDTVVAKEDLLVKDADEKCCVGVCIPHAIHHLPGDSAVTSFPRLTALLLCFSGACFH